LHYGSLTDFQPRVKFPIENNPFLGAWQLENQLTEIASRQFREHIIAGGNYVPITRRPQFWDKIAGSVTKHEAKRSARIYHQPAATAPAANTGRQNHGKKNEPLSRKSKISFCSLGFFDSAVKIPSKT
jgi:hypothetical protein